MSASTSVATTNSTQQQQQQQQQPAAGVVQKYDYATLLPPNWKHFITDWLQEDIPSFDYGGFVVGDKTETALLYCKARGVVCGVPFFNEVFAQCGCTVEWLVQEGELLDPKGGKINAAIVTGPCRKILIGERTALNIFARASGIATRARIMHDIVEQKKWHGRIAGTRKTTPGFRIVEKYALLVGGCDTHRMDLSSMIMLKDNHVKSTGSITAAVKKARSVGGFALKIEVECGKLEDALEAAKAGADVVMLDNFNAAALAGVAAELRRQALHVLIEASGGITMETVGDFMGPNVDVISMGALTQGVEFVDFSLKISDTSAVKK